MTKENPFVLRGYVSEDRFCDREQETRDLIAEIESGNNITLIAPRRIGKTGLIQHVFHQPQIKSRYYTFLIDIYATKTLEELVQEMGRSIVQELKSKGRKLLGQFVDCLHSLRSSISFDSLGNPSWNVEVGDIRVPTVTLTEVFDYLEHADKPCIVAIDEFQAVGGYRGGSVEALLRTHIQRCHNATFIFSGSQRNMMSEMFLSHSRPFYQSTSIKSLSPIRRETYISFSQRLFADKQVSPDTIARVYDLFDGTTWYMQRMMNKLYSMRAEGADDTADIADEAIAKILEDSNFAYQSLLFQLPSKQKELLKAIARENKAQALQSATFIRKYNLQSASSVQAALKGLLEKDFVTEHDGCYEVCDKFFRLWMLR